MRGIKPRRILVVVGLLAVMGIGAYVVVHTSQSRQKTAQRSLCVNDVIGTTIAKDISVLTKQNVTILKPIAKDITVLKNYEKSPTCLYVLTVYYINAADAANAQATYVKLKEVLKPGVTYGSNIQKATTSLKDLELLIEGVRLRTEQYKKNTLFGPVVPK
jgi:hypothetical protein